MATKSRLFGGDVSKITQEDLEHLRPVKIHFTEKKDEEIGYYTLHTSGMPVQSLPNGKYIVNKLQCDMLEKKGIKYQLD